MIPAAGDLPTRVTALVREFQAALGNGLAQRRVHQLVDVELHLVSRVRSRFRTRHTKKHAIGRRIL